MTRYTQWALGAVRRVVVEALTYHLIEFMMSAEQILSLKALRATN